MLRAIKKAQNQRELSIRLKIPRSKIWKYRVENIALKEERLKKIIKYIDINLKKEDIEKELPDNWRQITGGKNCVNKKIKGGTLNKQLEESRRQIPRGKGIGDWHKKMKKENPEAYHIIQYEHFKKIGNYKCLTENDEKVRNILEKEIANILKAHNLPYKYEPLIKADNEYFFPDFLIGNRIIIECTMWRGYDKAFKLKQKIEALKNEYKIYVVIPKNIEKYYKALKNNLILGLEEFENKLNSAEFLQRRT